MQQACMTGVASCVMRFEGPSEDARCLAVILLLFKLLEWRNWQTHGTQNPAHFTVHVGSTPTSSTTQLYKRSLTMAHLAGC